jgi:hypothetical protein
MKRNAITLLLALAVLASELVCAAKVYKWTDDQGNVIYSDTPHSGAVEIDIPTKPAGIVPLPPETPRSRRPAAGKENVESYDTLAIVAPTNEQVLDNPQGRVDVSLIIKPPLRTDQRHAIRVMMDGRPLEMPYTATEIAVTNVERGSHALEVEIINRAGNVLLASKAVTFQVHEPSRLAPAGPDIYPPVYPPQPYPPTYKPVYSPQPYQPQGRPKPSTK